jgi:Ca2+-binding RTX toxin-like protein
LAGTSGDDELAGNGGHDKLEPGSGDDPMISGGGGSDTVRYANVGGGGVSVDLAAGTVTPLGTGNSGTDALAEIENVVGSSAQDELRAQLAGIASSLEGGDGADSIETSDGDTLDSAKGGAGADTCTTDAGDMRWSCP